MSKELKPTPKSPKMITLEIMMDYKSDGVDYAEENGIEAIKTRLKQEVEAYKADLSEQIKNFREKADDEYTRNPKHSHQASEAMGMIRAFDICLDEVEKEFHRG